MAKPYFKRSHQTWFVNLKGETIRLGKTAAEAHAEFAEILNGKPWHKHKVKKWLRYIGGKIVSTDSPETPATAAAAPRPADSPTVADVAARYIAYVKRDKSEGTYTSYERYSRYLCEQLGSRPAAEVRGCDIEDACHATASQRTKKRQSKTCKLSTSAQKQFRKVAINMYRWATEQGLLAVNPLAAYRNRGKYGVRESYVSQEQYDKLIAACQDGELRDVLVCLWHTAARVGELLQVAAGHLQGRKFLLSRANGDTLKCHETRDLILNDAAWEVVGRLVAQRPSGRLFAWTDDNLRRHLKTLGMRAGVPGVTPHQFRHGAITEHLIRGTDISTLAKLCGHSVKTLATVYSHVHKNDDHMLAAANRLVAA